MVEDLFRFKACQRFLSSLNCLNTPKVKEAMKELKCHLNKNNKLKENVRLPEQGEDVSGIFHPNNSFIYQSSSATSVRYMGIRWELFFVSVNFFLLDRAPAPSLQCAITLFLADSHLLDSKVV